MSKKPKKSRKLPDLSSYIKSFRSNKQTNKSSSEITGKKADRIVIDEMVAFRDTDGYAAEFSDEQGHF